MADSKISALPASTTPLAGTEVLPIVQSSTTKQVSVANLTAGRSFDALGMTLTSTDAGATAAPLLELYRDSASPAASDTLGEIEFNGEDSAGNKQAYGLIHASILSPTSTAEQGQLHFETATAGALTEKMIIGTTNLVINEIGAVYNVRIEGDTDANLFYTDATNSRVGIGTITPAQKLDVAGAAAIQNVLFTAGTLPAAGNPSIALRSSDNNIYFQSGSANQINFLESAQNVMYAAAATSHTWNISNVTKMSINSSGVVTMNNYGAGAATFSAAGVISSVSDETWKIKDGVPVNPDEMLQKLEPGYWFYNDEKKETFGADRQLGFYAQNVHAAIGEEAAPVPEKVKDQDGNDTDISKPWGYYDRSVLAVVVMSLKNALSTIQEQQASIAQLQARLDAANL